MVFFFVAALAKFVLGLDVSYFIVFSTLAMLVANLVIFYLVKRGFFDQKDELLHNVHLLQLMGEIVLITVIIHFIAGITYLGFIFYTFFVVYSIIAFSRRDFYIQLAAIIICFSALVLLEYFGIIEFHPLFSLNNQIYKDPVYVIVSLALVICTFIFLAFFAKIPAERLEETMNELNQANLELEKKNEELAKLDQTKSTFISLASHQLRSPLSAIKWGLDDLESQIADRINPEELAELKKIEEANNKVISLVNDLLNISRIEEKRFNYEFRPCNIEEIIRDSAGNLISLLAKKKINLKFDFPKTKLPYLPIDREKMMLAIENLLENAIKYNMEKGNITVKIERVGQEAIISIKDNGLGIPARQKDKIFTKFFRADNVIKFQTEGTGLGLYIVKNIILGHRGKIWFESEEGLGTTFYISLPLEHPTA